MWVTPKCFVFIGNTELENSNDTEQHIEGDIKYNFPIKTDVTFLSSYPINGLPVEMIDESDKNINFNVGSSNSYIYENVRRHKNLILKFKDEQIICICRRFPLRD